MGNDNSKELMAYRKNFLQKIKEKLEYKKQEILESNIDRKWLEAFKNANEDLINGTQIDLNNESELIDNYDDYDYSLEESEIPKVSIEDVKFDNIVLSNGASNHTKEPQENALKSSEDLREAYKKIKSGDTSLDAYSGADLIKIYAIMIEEYRMKEEIPSDEEIEKLEKENEALRKEIEKLEANDSNS